MNRFEQLIEYVINDEEQKARELFHDIVVAKSREIYESMMAEEAEEELDEAADEEEQEEEEELDESLEEDPMADIEEEEISMEGEEDDLGGDAADDFIDNVEASDDEEGGEESGEEAATKDDIMNLEDKLDELMAEFEAAMGGDAMGSNGDDMGPDEGGDAIEMDDTEEMMAENITLKQVHPKTTTSEEGDGKAGPVAFNAGARGMAAKPVKTTGGDSAEGPHDTAAYRNSTKDLIGKVGNSPAQGTQTLKPATKPHLGQASGVNNKSPLPSKG